MTYLFQRVQQTGYPWIYASVILTNRGPILILESIN